jgi:hypothetical protein
MKYLLIKLTALFLLAISFSAFSDENVPEYATVGPWSIRVDSSLGYGCFLMAEFEGGSLLRLGFDNSNDTIYVLIGDMKWKSIEYGKKYNVEIQFGDETKWTGNAKGFSFDPPNNEPWLWISISIDSDLAILFFQEFMQEQGINLFYKNSSISHLSLSDSYKAGLKLLECQETMNTIDEDPFDESKGSENEDPFAS